MNEEVWRTGLNEFNRETADADGIRSLDNLRIVSKL